MKNEDETRNYFIEDINQSYLISKKNKRVFTALNYIEHVLILASAVNGCVSIYDFVSLIGIPSRSSAVELKTCAITAEIKKYKSITKKKRKNHDKILLLAKNKLNSIEVLISRPLMNSYISHDEFVSIDNKLREYGDM